MTSVASIGLLLTVCTDSGGSLNPISSTEAVSTPTTIPTSAPDGLPPDISVFDLLESAVDAMQRVGGVGFHMDIQVKRNTQEDPVVIPIKFTGDIQRPDRMRGHLSVSTGFITIETDIVSINSTIYSTDITTGNWVATVGDAPFFMRPDEFLGTLPAALQDAVMRVETLNGIPTFLVSGVNSPGVLGPDAGDFEVSLWIGVNGRLLRQVTIFGMSDEIDAFVKGLGLQAGDAKGTIFLTLKLLDHGKVVNVEAPQMISK